MSRKLLSIILAFVLLLLVSFNTGRAALVNFSYQFQINAEKQNSGLAQRFVFFISNFFNFKNNRFASLTEKFAPKKTNTPAIQSASVIKKENSSISQLPLTSSIISQIEPDYLPIRNWEIDKLEIGAESAVLFLPEKNKFLYQKDINSIRPIASLTKLMTAIIVLENMDLKQEITISENALKAHGEQSGLMAYEKMSAQNLLYGLLLESSNDAAMALAEGFELTGVNLSFVDLMNKKAETLGLKNTKFVSPSGLEKENVSSALDLAYLMKYIVKYPLILEITSLEEIDIFSTDGKFKHHLKNTDRLLNGLKNIVGGKTGYTDEAGECMVLITKEITRDNELFYLISVVLDASDRFAETKKLIDWAREGYVW